MGNFKVIQILEISVACILPIEATFWKKKVSKNNSKINHEVDVLEN